jgi:hypothetical protein
MTGRRRLVMREGIRVCKGSRLFSGPHGVRAEAANVTSQGFASCNHTLILVVIKGLNLGTNSIKFTSNPKSRSDFDFSFEFH